MKANPEQALIFHITDVENLPGILAEEGLRSDALMAEKNPIVIGYGHIKERRLKEIRVPCCGGRFVGEFVPFYFCPHSPKKLQEIAGAMLHQTRILELQIRNLRRTRDLLLPRLLSGQISVIVSGQGPINTHTS